LLANELSDLCIVFSKMIGFNPHSPLLANEFNQLAGYRVHDGSFNPHSPLLANEFCAARAI